MGGIDLQQLGISAVTVAILIVYNIQARKDLRDERQYNKQIEEMFRRSSEKTLDTLRGLESALKILQERLK